MGTPSVVSRGSTLLPFIHADACYIDAVIVSKGILDTCEGDVSSPWGSSDALRAAIYRARPAVGRKSKQTPLATKNLLEDTDGLRRPLRRRGDAIHQ